MTGLGVSRSSVVDNSALDAACISAARTFDRRVACRDDHCCLGSTREPFPGIAVPRAQGLLAEESAASAARHRMDLHPLRPELH